eukprot:gene13811-28103_t
MHTCQLVKVWLFKHTRKAQYSWPTAPALKSTATATTTATSTATAAATTQATATGSKGNAKAKVVAAQPRRLHATTITAATASNPRHSSNRVGGSGGDSSSSSKGTNPAVHTTVAAFLKKLDLAHYADKFAAAGIDDAALCQIIDDVEDAAADGGGYGDDGSEDDGPNPAEELIIRVGARGGGAVKLRKALVKGGPKA